MSAGDPNQPHFLSQIGMLFPRLRHIESVIFGCDYPLALAIIPHLVIITSVLEYIILV